MTAISELPPHLLQPIHDAAGDIFEHSHVYEVVGGQNFDIMHRMPTFLVVAPHNGHTDSLAVRQAIPDDLQSAVVFPAPKDHWKEPVRWIASQLTVRTIEMARDKSGPGAVERGLKNIVAHMDLGFSAVVYAEGHRYPATMTIAERPFFPGIGCLIWWTEGKYPVIPIRLRGLEDMMPPGAIFPVMKDAMGEPKHTTVIVGQPMQFALPDNADNMSWPQQKAWFVQTTHAIKERIISLE